MPDSHHLVRLPCPVHPTRPGELLEPFVAVLRPPQARRVTTGRAEVIEIREGTVTIHPDLPPVPVWGYAVGRRGPATSPGPLLEVDAGQAVTVRFDNRLPVPPTLPFVADEPPDPMVPVGWTSTHLHGAHTRPGVDGWPDALIRSGQSQTCSYDNTHDNADLGYVKVAAAQWYHDQAANGTGHHVHAGLVGGYLVRDPREAELGLPTSAHDGELYLILQDRDLTAPDDAPTAAGGRRLRHRTTGDSTASFGPLTLVDGLLWPRISMRPNVYRLRLLNASNARTYRLHLVRLTGGARVRVAPAHRRLLVIGTDGGLMARAWAPSDDEPLVLAPGERLDVLLDLTDLDEGSQVHLVNSAPAPFDGGAVPDLAALLRGGDPGAGNPYPQVARFDVRPDAAFAGAPDPLFGSIARAALNPAVPRLADLDDPQLHTVLIAESDAGRLHLHELVADPDGRIALQLPDEPATTTYSVVGWPADDSSPSDGRSSWYDRIGVMAELGRWQVFRFVNTTRHTRPVHLNQSQVQPLGATAGRVDLTDAAGVPCYDASRRATRSPLRPSAVPLGRRYEPTETRGWKDVVRVDPGEVVSLAVRFDRPGRYAYQCQLLENENTSTMRPFVVVVAAARTPGPVAEDQTRRHR